MNSWKVPSNALHCISHFIVNISLFTYIHSAYSIQRLEKSNFKIDQENNDSPDTWPERIKGKKARENENILLRNSTEFMALFAPSVRVLGEMTTSQVYKKEPRKM